MRVLILSNGELQEKEIENTLEELQKIVGGYIEFPFLSRVFNENKINIIINEEGKFIDGLKPEIAIIISIVGSVILSNSLSTVYSVIVPTGISPTEPSYVIV